MNTQSVYKRRHTHPVHIGSVTVGGNNPVVIQTMTNTSTLDTEATAAQIARCVAAGAPVVRMTAQGIRHARNLAQIRNEVNRLGVNVSLVADIHFNPEAAFEAALHVEKVRINPGNFIDPARTFKHFEYSPEEYAAELSKLESEFVPLLELCRHHNTALRIGVNHGSLSDRIMSRYGDTPEGMVESAMEFLRIACKHDFRNIVISIKASNVVVMTRTVRMLALAMENENMTYPLHLGVTEAGDGEDGRVKSAVGIGTLLAEGLGDTIRVSLSEEPEAEIPVARLIIEHINRIADGAVFTEISGTSLSDKRCEPTVAGYDHDGRRGRTLTAIYPADWDADTVTVAASIDLGSRLLDDSTIDCIEIVAPGVSKETLDSLALTILQATRRRISKTEYIACPGCGRTLFDLHSTLSRIKKATGHLKGLKIGVMGCIVNGPGEMADADYGYVGGAKNCVSLYRGRECVIKNIPADEAVERLLEIIEEDGRATPEAPY